MHFVMKSFCFIDENERRTFGGIFGPKCWGQFGGIFGGTFGGTIGGWGNIWGKNGGTFGNMLGDFLGKHLGEQLRDSNSDGIMLFLIFSTRSWSGEAIFAHIFVSNFANY